MPKSTAQGFKLPEHVSPDSVLLARLIPRIVNDVYELEVLYSPVSEKPYTGKGVFSCVSFIYIVECNKERKQNEYV